MKNICFFNTIVFWGGGEKLHFDNAVQFRKRHYNITIVSDSRSELSKRTKKEDIPLFTIRAGSLSFLNPFKIIRLIRFFKAKKIDAVVFTTSQDAKLGGFAASLAGVEKIIYLRGLAVPVKASRVNRFLFKNVLTHIIANSQETKKMMLLKLGKYVPESRIKVIYHGLDIQQAMQKESSVNDFIHQNKKGIVLGSAGRLTRQKGHAYLIRVAARLKEMKLSFTLFIAGSGELEEELTSSIEKLGLQEEVKLMGFVADMNSFMNSLDIFLLGSEWEGFGFVLVEAMIKSKPVVAFNMTSNPEIVSDGITGYLIPFPDIEMFAQKTKFLMENEVIRTKMGNDARQSVIERFDIEKITENIIQYLNQ
jgi:glycosyltransferase involved in cell wall biosynthesis